MTDSIPETHPNAGIMPYLQNRGLIAACCASTSFFLLYNHTPGINLPLNSAILAATAVLTMPAFVKNKTLALSGFFLVLGILAQIEDCSLLSASMGALALASFVLTSRDSTLPWHEGHCRRMAKLLFAGPFSVFPDSMAWLAQVMSRHESGYGLRMTARIGLPLLFTGGFLLLFNSANPLIHLWISKIDLQFILDLLDPFKIGFWIWMFAIAWSFVSLKRAMAKTKESAAVGTKEKHPSPISVLFDVHIVLISLCLFNILFAFQTALDAAYLWGGVALPDGVSYATYAHQGAYPLVITALLAAAFVLVAMRKDGPADQSKFVRPLVLVWVLQNILLVVSSILRLQLYVSVFSMTELRFAAFIWMGLVGFGLIFILAKIIFGYSLLWLVRANAIALVAVLYGYSLINSSAFIAEYNVAHSKENNSTGSMLDLEYLGSLGPDAIPAFDIYLSLPTADVYTARQFRRYLAVVAEGQKTEWQSWTFREWRLKNYLETNLLPYKYPDRPTHLPPIARDY